MLNANGPPKVHLVRDKQRGWLLRWKVPHPDAPNGERRYQEKLGRIKDLTKKEAEFLRSRASSTRT